MALTVTTKSNPAPAAKVVPVKEVQDAASAQGSPFAAKAIAITKPKLHHETNQLNFETVTNKSGTQFRFKSGTLPLTLSQEILVADTLSECARKIWLAHEQDHVSDNDSVLQKMEAELRKDTAFAEILLFPKWTALGKDKENFTKVQKTIGERIGVVFRNLTTASAAARDTPAEYTKVEAEIKKNCP